MDSLPPELILGVLGCIDFSENNPTSLINAASVCKQWHDIIYSHPSFWTALTVPAHKGPLYDYGSSHADEFLAYVKRFFDRSGGLPLSLQLTTVYMELTAEPQITDFLIRASRLETLSIEARPPWSQPQYHGPWLHSLLKAACALSQERGSPCWNSMRSLTFESKETGLRGYMELPLSDVAPLLERVELAFHHVEDYFVWASFVKLQGLRHLRIAAHFLCSSDDKATFALKTIGSLPHLESLAIHDRDEESGQPILQEAVLIIVPSLPVTSLTLSHLDLWDNLATRWSLCHLLLPALSSLRLYRDYPTIDMSNTVTLGGAISLLVQRSTCRLKILRLEAISPVVEGLLATLQGLETLAILELRCGCAAGGFAADVGDRVQSLRFMHDLSTKAAPFSMKSSHADFLPALKDFVYHDDLLDAKYIPDLLVHFKSFVEHCSRRSSRVTTLEAEFRSTRRGKPPLVWRKRRPGASAASLTAQSSNSSDERFDLIKQYVPMERAVLYTGGHSEPPIYSRVVEPEFLGPPEAAAASRDRLNALSVQELKCLMERSGVTAICSKPKKEDLIGSVLTALHPPTNAQVDSILTERHSSSK